MWYANESIILTKTFANDMLWSDLTDIKAHKYDKIGLHFANGIIIIMDWLNAIYIDLFLDIV